MSRKEQESIFMNLHDKGWRNKYALKKDDRRLTHDDLKEAIDEWKKNKRFRVDGYEWIEDRHSFTAATADDIPFLLEVRAAFYTRLSDECLYEVKDLERLIHWLGRTRYRKVPGACLKVEPMK